jgi:hypothetical protein
MAYSMVSQPHEYYGEPRTESGNFRVQHRDANYLQKSIDREGLDNFVTTLNHLMQITIGFGKPCKS